MSRPLTYGATLTGGGAIIGSVDAGTPAWQAGIRAGDRLVSANGRTLRDVIDWQWEADGPSVEVAVASVAGERTHVLERLPGQSWGIDFAGPLFDGVRTCRNACVFCFMAQLPGGLRPALYVRDDDYRLSFLQGNFVTLTNLEDADVKRIAEQHLSPLYVSLHAVTPEVRRQLICARDDRALERTDELLAAGIGLHFQIVLVPGVNDGDELDRTLTWLAEREGVRSIGVVPVGHTRHQARLTESYTDPAQAAQLLARIEEWRAAFKARDGSYGVYAADEFYLVAGWVVPEASAYDGFPQYENGIGLVRGFLDDFAASAGESLQRTDRLPVTLLTGELFAPVLEGLVAASGRDDSVEVLPVRNAFFGGNVSVAGLLTGADIVGALSGQEGERSFVLPSVVFNDEGLTLDGMDVDTLIEASGGRLAIVPPDAASLRSAIL